MSKETFIDYLLIGMIVAFVFSGLLIFVIKLCTN